MLVNKRLSAACYRPQTLASDLAKSLFFSQLVLIALVWLCVMLHAQFLTLCSA